MDNEGSMRINTTHKEQLEVPDSGAYLLAVVEVDREDRIQCQAEGRGHSVYKRIHVVLTGMAFKVLGSQCYERPSYAHQPGATVWNCSRQAANSGRAIATCGEHRSIY
jgi:hypothetical protein